jgi:hypothetical protein
VRATALGPSIWLQIWLWGRVDELACLAFRFDAKDACRVHVFFWA